jgi:CheY-like chemotaxis protein
MEDGAIRRERFRDLHHEVGKLKRQSGQQESRPVSLIVNALEGLLKQLTNQLSVVTPSMFETIEGALDLLQSLHDRGSASGLASHPIRLLAVDDDAVIRLTISLALKKAFSKPDIASDAATALRLLRENEYDVIFLDVEMPGMDGFELCEKIRETGLNQSTPVIFVTRHSDFDSRLKSTFSGGNHLIGKPFLSFEITLKALTVAVGNRLLATAVGAN